MTWPLHWPGKKQIFMLTHNPIALNIENKGLFLPFPIDPFKILTNLPNLITHSTVSSVKQAKQKELKSVPHGQQFHWP